MRDVRFSTPVLPCGTRNIPDVTEVQQKCLEMVFRTFLSAITILLSIQPWEPLITQRLNAVMDYFNLFHSLRIQQASIELHRFATDAGA